MIPRRFRDNEKARDGENERYFLDDILRRFLGINIGVDPDAKADVQLGGEIPINAGLDTDMDATVDVDDDGGISANADADANVKVDDEGGDIPSTGTLRGFSPTSTSAEYVLDIDGMTAELDMNGIGGAMAMTKLGGARIGVGADVYLDLNLTDSYGEGEGLDLGIGADVDTQVGVDDAISAGAEGNVEADSKIDEDVSADVGTDADLALLSILRISLYLVKPKGTRVSSGGV
ncbi:hypothetical protein MKZ38_002083 [Zalerion maritima]|uniref:Uncharacterized protein n=1 Tax=Zalerion maritima TaxID=339359 RepID=A0AAD5RXM1_9PEZI|nr:hypothetical protein MKZ38_002083 [Zalerion maritima]